ncbi:MAG: glycosyltransferase family 87 protein, partial [Beijerinckiaceae bacterium]
MTDIALPAPPARPPATVSFSPFMQRGLIGVLLLCFGLSAMIYMNPPSLKRAMLDFDAFYLTGSMALRGVVNDAYTLDLLFREQVALAGKTVFMPWTYPPPFNLIVAGLALLPLGMAYLVFVGVTLTAYLFVLHRLSGPHFYLMLVLATPGFALSMFFGQNGFLSGALLGAAGLRLLSNRDDAGIPLGLMVIKPHVAVTLGVYALFDRRWRVIAVATVSALAACALATLVFGFSIWPAFMGGVAEAGQFLRNGEYPLHRMISVYAAVRRMGVAPDIALAMQMITALAALAGIALAMRARLPRPQIIGFALLTALLISPYAYDYDLPIFTLGIALLMPVLLTHGRGHE